MEEKNRYHNEIRILYAGNKNYINLLIQDFLRTGARFVGNNDSQALLISGALLRKLALVSNSFPDTIIHFYSDIYELAKFLPRFDADLVIVDERTLEKDAQANLSNLEKDKTSFELDPKMVLHTSSLLLETESTKEVSFELLQSAIEKFTPREFNYTTRRILVVLPSSVRKTNREFKLTLSNVRGSIVDPSSPMELFLYATRSLFDFYQNHKKTALCISGGGLDGYLYSVGVVHALENSFQDKTCYDFNIFSGVSSGSILASSLSIKLTSEQIIKQIFRRDTSLEHFGLNTLFDIATGEIAKKSLKLLRAFSTPDLAEAMSRFQDAIPIGFFRGEKLKQFLERQLEHVGIENNIGTLEKELYIGVTDQDTGEYIVFGEEPWRDVKISQAVRASTAIPTFYLPEKINGHWFADGQLSGGSGFSHAIQKGAGLVVNIDPMVGYRTNNPGGVMKRGGYFALIQALKTLVESRAESMLKHAMDKNPDVDFINFAPTDEVMEAMAGNPMKYHIRTELVELGFKCAVSQILSSYAAFFHKFAKHGFILKNKDDISELRL